MSTIDTARRLARWGGWAALLFVAFVTLSPIELRPHFAGVNEERLGAYAVIGFLFAFGYPRRALAIAVLTILAAVSLEWGQTFVLGRHGRAADALVKICGALGGVCLAWGINSAAPPRKSLRKRLSGQSGNRFARPDSRPKGKARFCPVQHEPDRL